MAIPNNLSLGSVGWVGATTGLGVAWNVGASNADQQYSAAPDSAMLGAGVGIVTAGLGLGAASLVDYSTKNDYEHLKNGAKRTKKYGTKTLEALGGATIGAAKGSAEAVAGTSVGLGKKIANNFFEIDKVKHNNLLGGVGLNKKGKFAAAMIGAGLIMSDMFKTENEIRKGTPSGFATSTPVIDGPSMDNYRARQAETYGAGGDLVFALNANRRG